MNNPIAVTSIESPLVIDNPRTETVYYFWTATANGVFSVNCTDATLCTSLAAGYNTYETTTVAVSKGDTILIAFNCISSDDPEETLEIYRVALIFEAFTGTKYTYSVKVFDSDYHAYEGATVALYKKEGDTDPLLAYAITDASGLASLKVAVPADTDSYYVVVTLCEKDTTNMFSAETYAVESSHLMRNNL